MCYEYMFPRLLWVTQRTQLNSDACSERYPGRIDAIDSQNKTNSPEFL